MAALAIQTGPFASAEALRGAIRSGELSAVEATEHFLSRIADRGDLGAFVTVTPDSALAEAAAADASLAAHRSGETAQLPPLLGVPIAHKDLIDVAGVATSSGSAALPDLVATADHPVVAALRSAGMVGLGKTQVPELGLTCYSENLIAPPARNPHDPSRTPGGSSGGSAAAVAAGLLPAAVGSDGGGSIRIPALACGLVGLKPGLGAIAGDVTRGFVDEFGAPLLTVSGPIAHTAADAALLMDELASPAARGTHINAVRRAAELTGLTVATSTTSPFEHSNTITLSEDAKRAFTAAAVQLGALGHRVEEASFSYDPEYTEFFTESWIAGLSLLRLDPASEARLTPLTREFRARAMTRSLAQHRATGARMQGFASEARALWGQTDVVLTPGLSGPAPHIGAFTELSPTADYRMQCEWTPYTSMVNISGLPAIAVPMFLDASGLPVGVQLIGRAGSEPQLLALAEQLMAGATHR